MSKKIIKPKVVNGGRAIPLGNNFYYMQGRKHEQGGIDIGADDKNGLEVEGGEVIHASKNSIKVFSAVPMLKGKSPAEKVLNGENANKVFKEQEKFKDKNGYNDDGTKKYKTGGQKRKYIGGDTNEARQKYYDTDREFTDSVKVIAKRYNINPNLLASRIAREGHIDDAINYYNETNGEFDRKEVRGADWGLDDTGENLNKGIISLKEPWLTYYDDTFFNKKGRQVNSVYSKDWNFGISATAAELKYRRDEMKKRFPNLTEEELDAAASAAFNRGIAGATDYIKRGNNLSNYKPFIIIKKMGGLSRNKDYGSSKKPYPSVKSTDFAGKNRTYPIPTKDDAIDALRLAGLHGRSDIKTKVYSKYPELKNNKDKKEFGGRKSVFVELNIGGKKKLISSSSFTGEPQKALLGKEENYIEVPKYKGIIEEVSSINPNLSPDTVKEQLNPFKPITHQNISISTNSNNKTQSIVPSAGQFREITAGDIISGITNTIGSIVNYSNNKNALNKMRYSSAPIPIQSKKLKTKFNINSQLDKIREYLKETNRDVDNNTASSRVALARKGRARINALLQANDLYNRKENIETQLLNQDSMNQQNVAARNVESYNRWRERKANFDNLLLDKKAENVSNLISGLTTTVGDIIGGIEERKAINNTLSTIAAANPNVTAEILRDLGVDFDYMIRNGKRIRNNKKQ